MAYKTIKGGELRERVEATERYAGYAVRDRRGRKIGNLERRLVSEAEGAWAVRGRVEE